MQSSIYTSLTRLIDCLKLSVEANSQRIAIQQWEEDKIISKYTYQELWDKIQEWAKLLQATGIKPSDRIIILGNNSIEWVIAFFAIHVCACTPVLIDAKLGGKDYESLIDMSDPQLIIADKKLFQKISPSKPIRIPVLNLDQHLSPLFTNHTVEQNARDGNSSIAVILFTSGTTGAFRGVMLDHMALIYGINAGEYASHAGQGDRHIILLPFTHVFGLIACLLGPLHSGGTMTLVAQVQGDVILKVLRETKSTFFATVPRLLDLFYIKIKQKINDQPPWFQKLIRIIMFLCKKTRELTGLNIGRFIFFPIHRMFGGHLKVFPSGGATLAKEVFWDLEALGFTIIEGYGLSETTAIAICANISDRHRQPGSVGKPMPWMQLKIDPPASEGELMLRGPMLMQGYFRDEEATRQAFKEGWFGTGDLGKIDDKGYVYITGRLKEIIVTASGKKAMPQDIERRYQGIDGVEEMAVFGMPSSTPTIEEVHAAIVINKIPADKPFQQQFYEQIVNRILKRSEEVPAHLRIYKIHRVDVIPKTSTFKVKRLALRDMLKNQQQQATQKITDIDLQNIESDDPISKKIMLFTLKILKNQQRPLSQPLTPDTSFQIDLGFDSLTAFDLAFMVEEEFHIRLGQERLNEAHTIHNLTNIVKSLVNEPLAEKKEILGERGVSQQIMNFIKLMIEKENRQLQKPLSLKSEFKTDLGFDDIALSELIFTIEEHYHIRISPNKIAQIQTVGNLAQFVNDLLNR